MKKAVLFEEVRENIVKCTACAHYCRIMPGRAGVCGIRKNKQGVLYLLTYGIAAAVHTDPIEKKPLFHFLPGTDIFSFSTVGCNFGCLFCQNWDISQFTREGGTEFDIGKAGAKWPPGKIVEHCVSNSIPSIAYTYNEPTVFFEYAYDTARLAKKHGIKNVFVSNGYGSAEAYNLLRNCLDAINIDLKAFSPDFYRDVCRANIKPVLQNIRICHSLGIWTEITTLVIPGENDSPEELGQIAEFIAGIDRDMPWHISRFFPHYRMPDTCPTPPETLMRAYEIGRKAGLNYVYVGNYPSDRESTFCPSCNKTIVERKGYSAGPVQIRDGKCRFCGFGVKGVWR